MTALTPDAPECPFGAEKTLKNQLADAVPVEAPIRNKAKRWESRFLEADAKCGLVVPKRLPAGIRPHPSDRVPPA